MRLTIVLALLFTINCHAASSSILRCLGEEEKTIFMAKKNGAFNHLNQALISKLLQLSSTVKLKSKYLNHVCDSKENTKSLTLLKIMLMHDDAFYSTRPEGDLQFRSIDEEQITDLRKQSTLLFIELINNLQAQAKKPNCLQSKIPELNKIMQNGRYLLEELGLDGLVEHKYEFQIVLKKLRNPNLLNDC